MINVRWLLHCKTTPGLLKLKLFATWAGCALLFLATCFGVAEHRSALLMIGHSAVPNIVNAQRIRAGLSELDAQAANELVGKPGENMKAVKTYDTRLKEVTLELGSASEHISLGEEERSQIKVLSDGLMRYNAWITQACDMQSRGDASVLAAYRHATQLMHGTLLPAAERLDQVNSDGIERTYSHHKVRATLSLALLAMAGLFVVAMLVVKQIFLSIRMRRTFNPALLAATLGLLVYLLYAVTMLCASAHKLESAKTELYPQLSTLWRARATAFQAKGQTSSWLLDRPLAASYQSQFNQNVLTVKELPLGAGFDDFISVDAKVRQLELAGQHSKAVSIAIGKDPGELNYAFDKYDSAMSVELNHCQRAFDSDIDSGLSSLRLFFWLAPIVALLAAALAQLGLHARIREYHH